MIAAAAPVRARASLRWAACFLVVLLLHVAAFLHWRRAPPPSGQAAPEAIFVELPAPAPTPAPPAPPPPPQAAAPVVQADPPPPLPIPVEPKAPLVTPPKPRPHHKVVVHHDKPPPVPVPQATAAPTSTVAPPSPATNAASHTNAPPHPAAVSGSAAPNWERELLARIAAFKHYPDEAERRSWSGTVVVRFAMRRDGSIVSASVARSSGHDALDDAAVASVRDAAPLPRPPESVAGDPITLALPLRFDLDEQ